LGYNFIVYTLIPLLFLVGIISNFSFAEENTRECRIRVSLDQSLTPLERITAIKECSLMVQRETITGSTSDISHTSEKIIKFCEASLPIFRTLNELLYTIVTGHPFSRPCTLLFNEPIWNYTGPDRPKVLLDFLHDKVEKDLEDTKEEREKSQVEARLRQGQIMYLVELFEKQDEKIEFLEKQLEEKMELIANNELLIQEQQETIENLKQKIKNVAFSSTDFASTFVNKELLECLKNTDLESLPHNEKIKTLQECSNFDDHKLMVINDKLITSVTKGILDFCQDSYPSYLEFGERIYYKSQQHPVVTECVWLYQQPIWSYQGPDRNQMLIEAGKPHVEQYLNEKIMDRQKSVYDANMSKGRYMVVTHVYNLGEQQISDLESIILEIDELIDKHDTIPKHRDEPKPG